MGWVLKKHHGARDSENGLPQVGLMVSRAIQHCPEIFLEGIHLDHSACHTITSSENKQGSTV
jgi:hypothetical protein